MLSVQRVNLMNHQSFGNAPYYGTTGARRQSDNLVSPAEQQQYDEAVGEWSLLQDKLNDLEEMVPEKVKKPYKFFKAISTAVITGLGVVWASKKVGLAAKKALTSLPAKKFYVKARNVYRHVEAPLSEHVNKFSNLMKDKLHGTKFQKGIDEAINVAKQNKYVQKANVKVHSVFDKAGQKIDKITILI